MIPAGQRPRQIRSGQDAKNKITAILGLLRNAGGFLLRPSAYVPMPPRIHHPRCFLLVRGRFGDTESWRNYYRPALKICLAFMSLGFSLVAIFVGCPFTPHARSAVAPVPRSAQPKTFAPLQADLFWPKGSGERVDTQR